jgi:putative ABC transport system permease protein
MNTSFDFQLGPVVNTLVAATILTLLFGFSATYRALGQKAAPLLRNH